VGVPKGKNPDLPHNYTPDCVVYTGTHDNDTTVGWLSSLPDGERTSVLRYLATDGSRIALDLMRLAHQSVAAVAIVPLQDLLELGPEARMNVPGRPDQNWTWRFTENMVDSWRIEWIANLTAATGRWNPEELDEAIPPDHKD
jgi:4-alpha-glucanotransferase